MSGPAGRMRDRSGGHRFVRIVLVSLPVLDAMTHDPTPTPTSVRTHARIAGLLYLVVIVCAGFAEGVVRTGLVVPGDPAATAAAISASEGLFRLGFAADLVAFASDVGVAILLYVLLRPVNRTLSMVAAALRLIAHPAIASLNLLNMFGALLLIGGGDHLAAFEPAQLQGLALLLLDAHGYGYLIAGVFFGLHLLVLGHLIFRSPRFPPVLGALLGLAGLGYLVESFGTFLFPGPETLYTWIVAVPAVLGELSLALWLVVRGVREPAT